MTGKDPASTTPEDGDPAVPLETPTDSKPRRAKGRYNSILSLQRIRTLPPLVGATLAGAGADYQFSGDGFKRKDGRSILLKTLKKVADRQMKRRRGTFHDSIQVVLEVSTS